MPHDEFEVSLIITLIISDEIITPTGMMRPSTASLGAPESVA